MLNLFGEVLDAPKEEAGRGLACAMRLMQRHDMHAELLDESFDNSTLHCPRMAPGLKNRKSKMSRQNTRKMHVVEID
jgi:hypothetical protein